MEENLDHIIDRAKIIIQHKKSRLDFTSGLSTDSIA
jgi:hypothetical protein